MVPALIGLLLGLVVVPLLDDLEPRGVLHLLVAYLVGQSAAPFFTIFAVSVALLVGAWALRMGWAGHAMAVLLPVGVIGLFMLIYAQTETGYAPVTYFTPAMIFCFSGALHGLVMWHALRWRRPKAVGPR